MRQTISLILIGVLMILPLTAFGQKSPGREVKQLQSPQNPPLGIVIHGGAGVITRGTLTPEQEKEYRAALEQAVLAGYKILQAGGTSLDAVEAAVRIMEDSPLFNAGKGAVFTSEGTNELDASIMDGKTLKAGAVATLKRIKNPISLARLVMQKSPHVMMIGEGAEKFARENGVETVPQSYFFTQRRFDALKRIQEEEKKKAEAAKEGKKVSLVESKKDENRHGTVGAVAVDKFGNLAAATSTGGMTNKKFGRVGDAPIIGAGTYANNNSCAVSATGWGEYFIRLGVARDISAIMEYQAMPIQQAVDAVIQRKLPALGKMDNEDADGGVIAIDKFGNIGISFNSEGMYRAYIDMNGKPVVQIYKD
ncbi:MAG TPA: isoaspartyl peptidase/L-asparaginase [Pyrinomonadaceae bacterium]|nr:isoaspartyl peptidase/L-asparaginase [Pyrinomonadaceae bacterium]